MPTDATAARQSEPHHGENLLILKPIPPWWVRTSPRCRAGTCRANWHHNWHRHGPSKLPKTPRPSFECDMCADKFVGFRAL